MPTPATPAPASARGPARAPARPHDAARAAPRRARRWQEAAACAAILGTLGATLLAAGQVRRGWAQQRAASERALREHLRTAAVIMGAEVARMSGLEVRALLWPVLGTGARPDARPLTLAEVARAGARQLRATSDDPRAARPGFFRLGGPPGTPGPHAAELAGALAGDSAYARVVLGAARALAAGLPAPRAGADGAADSAAPRLAFAYPTLGGVQLVVGLAREQTRGDGRGAVFGVAYVRDAALRSHVRHVLAGTPLLPATFDGVDWRTARRAPPASGRASATADAAECAAGRVADNALLSARLLHAARPAEARAPGPRFAATGAVGGPDGGVAIRVALPDEHGARLVAAVTPFGREQRVLDGALLLALGSAAAALVGVRRQHRLAQARAAFVAAASHELRTPLAHINALSETLLLGRAESPEQARRWLRAISREGQRLAVVAENVLLHARGEGAALRAAPRRTEVAALVREVVGLVEGQADARSATVAVDAPGDAYATVDPGFAHHALLNLLDNALKYGPPGQTVTVAVRAVHAPGCARRRAPGGDAERCAVRVTVDDEGPGVPPRRRPRIWRPFVRLADAPGGPAGTGLGLSVVRTLMRAVGGRCWVQEAPGGGARFGLEFPAARCDAGRGARAAGPGGHGSVSHARAAAGR